MMNVWLRFGGVVLVLSSVACKPEAAPAPTPLSPSASEPALRPPASEAAPTAKSHLAARGPTTRWESAVKNLDAQVKQLEERRAAKRLSVSDGVKLVALYQQRAMFLGRLSDDEAALALANSLVKAHPKSPLALKSRASIRQRLHHFEEALADLSSAQALGADVARERTDILEATAPTDATLEAIRRDAQVRPTFDLLARLGAALAVRGQLKAADDAYLAAFAAYRDVSPFMVAWLEFQHGLLHERMEDWEGTRESWSRAEARLPVYAAAAAHLAELEPSHERAVALVRRAWDQSGDPTYAGQLAALLSKSAPEEARALRGLAAKAFASRMKRHPAAFADHAARFSSEGSSDSTPEAKVPSR